jgi:cytochrome c oxidase subunit 2
MSAESRRESGGRQDYLRVLVIVILVSIVAVPLSLLIHWFPTLASTEGKKIDTLYDVLLIFSVPMFVLVTTVVLYSVWKWHMRPGEEDLDGPPIHGNTRLEVVWTAFPAIMMVGLCSYAFATLHSIEKHKSLHMTVEVMAQQFAFRYTYPNGPGGKPVSTDKLYVPKGEQIVFRVHAKDVLHDFFVPAFRVKTDAVPGITTTVRATPSRIGTYPVVCAELCGLGHALMRSTIHVVSPSQFQTWLSSQKTSGA